MNKNNMQIVLSVRPDDDIEKVAAFAEQLREKGLIGRNRVSRGTARAAQAPARADGPFAKHWKKIQGVSYIRCVNGRDVESQAKHNLQTHRKYSDSQLAALAS